MSMIERQFDGDMPQRIARLPRDARGYPIPWFVAARPGEAPDLRFASPQKRIEAVRQHRCWVCGEPMGVYLAFAIGPMCGVNRVTAEPPAHQDCAMFSIRNCPFLSRPMAKRSERAAPDERIPAPGLMIERNPGVVLLWMTRSCRPFQAPAASGGSGFLISIGAPGQLSAWSQGRKATRKELDEAVNSGLPLLEEAARKEGREALAEFRRCLEVWAELRAMHDL